MTAARASVWRRKLMGPKDKWRQKRQVFHTFIRGRTDVDPSILQTIRADMPRTYPRIEWMQDVRSKIQDLLVSYAAVQRGDGYLQGFNYIMSILLCVFDGTEYEEADTWWCFARIVGLIRPMMPDFNTTWFHWYRTHWLDEFHTRLRKKRPRVESILATDAEIFSSLVTVKWFMIWFAQNVSFEEIFILWDFIIEQKAERLMHVYTLIAYQLVLECATTVTYRWSQEPSRLMHAILNMKVTGIESVIVNVRRLL